MKVIARYLLAIALMCCGRACAELTLGTHATTMPPATGALIHNFARQ